jgi:hypothetical protein
MGLNKEGSRAGYVVCAGAGGARASQRQLSVWNPLRVERGRAGFALQLAVQPHGSRHARRCSRGGLLREPVVVRAASVVRLGGVHGVQHRQSLRRCVVGCHYTVCCSTSSWTIWGVVPSRALVGRAHGHRALLSVLELNMTCLNHRCGLPIQSGGSGDPDAERTDGRVVHRGGERVADTGVVRDVR